ncbi:MAG TPA: glycosyltransferase family 4 protein [Chloroflexia bacterium]|nr:glycosyltransferase family 4 protein [Chloroflexia bacterium]
MRILHVIYDDIDNPWVGGGGATRTLEIYDRIAGVGHQVTVVCGYYRGAARREIRRGVRYRRLGLGRSHLISRLSFMVGAARLIKAGGYDIVIEDVSPFSPVGCPLWNRRVACVACVQNLSGEHATRKYGALGLGPKLVEKPLLSLYRNFIAVSPGIAEQLRRTVGGKINVKTIPNSAGQLFFRGDEATGDTTPCGGGYILSLGRIDVYQKGLDRLIEGFDLLADRLPEIRLKIAGGGTKAQVARLHALTGRARHGERIEILGQVDQARAASLMRGALMLAMPSRYEAWPLSAIEAAAAGVPVVGSNIVGVKDAAPQYPQAHGRLVPEGDIDALVAAMSQVVTDRHLRQAIGERGIKWAKRFTWDALAAEQLAFYESLIHKQQ